MRSDEVDLTLAVIDSALAGEPVAAENRALAELSVTLRDLRPQSSPEFASSLDARAASGFARRRSSRSRSSRPRAGAARRKGILLSGAAATLAAGLVALAVALSGSPGSRATSAANPESGRVSGAERSTAGATATGKTYEEKSKNLPNVVAGGKAEQQASASTSSSKAPAAAETPRQIERGSAFEVGVPPDAIQSSSQRVFTLVSNFKGYVQQSSVNSGGANGTATFDIRVPSANLSGAIAALSHIGHVRSESDNTNDVTSQYDSLQGSLSAVQAQREGVLRALSKGSEPEATLLSRLHALDARIASLQRQLHEVTKHVENASLALTLTAEAKAGASGGELTPGGAAGDAARILDAALAVLVLAAAAALPFAALVLAWLAFAAVRRRGREQALDAA